ncbi:MAG: EMC3/TMCO1 family protein [Candidatus Woesearchaeota archaeon]
MLSSLLNPIFSPILGLPPLVSIVIISLLVSFLITIVYKFMTDQTMMKDLKTRQKEFQKKMKEHRQEPDKLMKIQKQAMEVNMKYMTQSFKPTLITFIPIILIFGWLNANIAFEPIHPGQEFLTTVMMKEGYTGDITMNVPDGITIMGQRSKEIIDGVAQFTLKGDEGDYLLVFNHEGRSYDKELSITDSQRYAPVQKTFKDSPVQSISLGNNKLIALNFVGKEEGGITSGRLGWLGTYILFSLVFSLVLRKALKIY